MRRLILLLMLVPVLSPSAHAHHSRAMFQLNETIEIEGTVTEVAWKSPHVYVAVEAITDTGAREPWIFEGHTIAGLIGNGWQRESVEAGDRVVIVTNPNRRPQTRFGLLDNITLVDGSTFYSFRVPRGADADRPNRTPTAPSTDFSGTWRSAGRPGGAAGAGRGAGGADRNLQRALVGGFQPPVGWPLTEQAQAQVDVFDLNEDPWLDCVPLGVPRTVLSPFSHGWTRTEDSIVIDKELSPIDRVIHLDGSGRGEDFEPDLLGYSAGRIENDGTLVVETTGFAPTKWGLERGIDSSEQKRVTERFKLTGDGYGMTVSYTVEDPVFLSEPVTIEGMYRKVADHELVNEPCDLETTRRHLEFELE